jgi:hydroxymethylglutaryl-CoA lyase
VTLRERLPDRVTVVEVGPRDGLQNEPQTVPADVKVELIERLADAGLPAVEATSFVNPKWVPQLADAEEVLTRVERIATCRYPVLVPNLRGLERALACDADEVAVFASATEAFSQRNLNVTRDEAIRMFAPVCERAADEGLRVRGYVSMVLGDPWEGDVDPHEVARVAKQLVELGCYQISLGDTIGVGTPGKVQALIDACVDGGVSRSRIAVHFHDTYGQALANVLAALQSGVSTVDASAGGLGGCPFAKSATGNLATEDLIWMLDGLGIETGVDVRKVALASREICAALGKEPPGRVARVLAS